MAPDYSKGKVYIIRSPHTEMVYVGSTTLTLSQRMAEHRRLFNYYTVGSGKGKRSGCRSQIILNAGEAYIELLEEASCKSKAELNAREGHHQRLIGEGKLVNRSIAGRTDEIRKSELREQLLQRAREYDARRRAAKKGIEIPDLKPNWVPVLPEKVVLLDS
jgi:hypothetical protein